MKTFLNSTNFWTQVITLILSIFALGGANLDPVGVSDKLVHAIWDGSLWSIGSIVILNLVNPIYHWIRTPNTERWAFLHSLNWWVNFVSLVVGIGVITGIYSDNIYTQIPGLVQAAAERDWYNLLWIAGANFIVPVIKIFVPKLAKASSIGR